MIAAARDKRLLLLVLVALASRALVLGDPVVHTDEEFYFTAAWRWAHGGWPYVDWWDRKPIGLFLLYLPAGALPFAWGLWAYQLLALAFAVATAWVIADLATRAGWARGGTAAAIGYLLWLVPLGGMGGQSPVFYNLPMALAGWLVLAGGRRRGAAAMLLAGVAIEIKQAAVIEAAFFGLWLLAREWRRDRATGMLPGRSVTAYAALLATAVTAPTLLALGIYAARDQGGAWIYANVLSILSRHPDRWPEMLGNGATLALLLSPVAALVVAAWRRSGGGSDGRHFLFAWTAVAIGGVAPMGSWFSHYGLPVLVPGCACAAGALGSPRQTRTASILIAAALVGQAMLLLRRAEEGTPAQFARLAAAVGHGPGCLFVYSGPTTLYPATGRCAASRWLFPSHLIRARETGAVGVDQLAELRLILARRPAVVVMSSPYSGERPDARALVLATLARDYRPAATLPLGRARVALWTR